MLLAITVVAAFAYAGASAYVTILAAKGIRNPVEGSPADLGLVFEPVSFESAVDHTLLRGWYLRARGERAIVFVHGIDKNRWDAWDLAGWSEATSRRR